MMSSWERLSDITLKGFYPRLTLNPSAIDIGGNCGWIFLSLIDRYASPAFYGSTPIALHPFPKYLVDNKVPLPRPPPPIGNNK